MEGYPLVILDLNFGEPDEDGFVTVESSLARFYELGAEVARCLKAGGVVVGCLGPVANTPKKLKGPAHRARTHQLKRARLDSEQLPMPDSESSYDWLDQGLLRTLRLGHEYAKPSEGIRWNLPKDRYYRIREAFARYFEPFSEVMVYGDGTATITYRVEEYQRWDTGHDVCQPQPQILAFAEHTQLPVAMSFDYNHFGGLRWTPKTGQVVKLQSGS